MAGLSTSRHEGKLGRAPEIRNALLWRPDSVTYGAMPVAPIGNILEVFCAHDAHPTAGVDNVVEFNYA